MNYGKIIKLTFDGKVYNISSKEKTRFRLVNAYGEYIYPIDVTVGSAENEVYLHFDDINGLVFPAYLQCLQTIAMGSEHVSIGAFYIAVSLQNLWPVPGDAAYLFLSSVAVSGSIDIPVDVQSYLNDGYLQLSAVDTSGSVLAPSFYSRYLPDGYLQLSAVAVSGQYCDINGNPL